MPLFLLLLNITLHVLANVTINAMMLYKGIKGKMIGSQEIRQLIFIDYMICIHTQ